MIFSKGMFIDIRESEFQPEYIHRYLIACGNTFYTKQITFDRTKNVIEWTNKGLVINSKKLLGSNNDITALVDADIRYRNFKRDLPDSFILKADENNLAWLELQGVALANGSYTTSVDTNKIKKVAVKNKVAYIAS